MTKSLLLYGFNEQTAGAREAYCNSTSLSSQHRCGVPGAVVIGLNGIGLADKLD